MELKNFKSLKTNKYYSTNNIIQSNNPLNLRSIIMHETQKSLDAINLRKTSVTTNEKFKGLPDLWRY